jgi:hypothetical protein
MSDYVSFEGRIVPLLWGRATYTILPLPAEVATELARAKRVEGEINDHPVNLAPSRAPEMEGLFLWTGQSLLDRIGLTVGEAVEVRLRPAPDDAVDLPEDVALALRAADLTEIWEALTPGKRRGMLYQVASAKTAVTRVKRIGKLLEGLE